MSDEEGNIRVTSDFSVGSSGKRKRIERGSVFSQDSSAYDALISCLESSGEKMRRMLTRIGRKIGIDGENSDEVIDAFRDEEFHGGSVDKIDTSIYLLESIQVEMVMMLSRIDRKLRAEGENNGVQGDDDGSDEESLDEVIDAFRDEESRKRYTLMSLMDSFGEGIRRVLTRIETRLGIEQDNNNGVQGDDENVDGDGEGEEGDDDDGVDEENLDEVIDAFQDEEILRRVDRAFQDEEILRRVDKGKAPFSG